jgi:XRE family aerobic/anaerobic benzoate catabolism transcriptional regulator
MRCGVVVRGVHQILAPASSMQDNAFVSSIKTAAIQPTRPVVRATGDGHADFLATLGQRVRDARARHGMTRRMLAWDSGISERYLAELEGGRGNFSLLMLQKLAGAIGEPLPQLVEDGPPRPAAYTLLTERLRRLDTGELNEVSAMIAGRFGATRDRLDRIALIGLRGAGKSTLGPLLAQHLGYEFVEISRAIVAEAGASVEEVFEVGGQAAYRRYELRALQRLIADRTRLVLAAGGGLVSETATFQCLLDSCHTIWLSCTPREHWTRVMRQGDYRVSQGAVPAGALADMRRILAQREPLYQLADARLVTSSKTVRTSARELIELVERARRQAAERRNMTSRRSPQDA